MAEASPPPEPAPTGSTEPGPADAAPPAAHPNPPKAEPAPPAEDWQVKFRYLLAEFDNFRKRTEREREQLRRETRAQLLKQMLPLHDALARAEEFIGALPEGDPLRRGLELFSREWRRFLASESIHEVGRAGEPFRPEEEEAVGEVEATEIHPDGTIAEVIQPGFRSPAGLLRPARVLVARARAPPAEGTKPKGGADVARAHGDPDE
jgi:molecular chaperone GrpE